MGMKYMVKYNNNINKNVFRLNHRVRNLICFFFNFESQCSL